MKYCNYNKSEAMRIFNVEIHQLIFSIIIKFDLHLNECNKIENILSYLFFNNFAANIKEITIITYNCKLSNSLKSAESFNKSII